MQSIKFKKRVGADGILHLDIPLEMKDKEVEVIVIYQSIETATQTPEDLGYPPDFVEQTYGSCQDDPIVIDSEPHPASGTPLQNSGEGKGVRLFCIL